MGKSLYIAEKPSVAKEFAVYLKFPGGPVTAILNRKTVWLRGVSDIL